MEMASFGLSDGVIGAEGWRCVYVSAERVWCWVLNFECCSSVWSE